MAPEEISSEEVWRTRFQKFLYRVSHDLNAPLRHMILSVEILQEAARTGDRATLDEVGGVLGGAATRLQNQLVCLLELSRIETSACESHEAMEARSLIEQAVELSGVEPSRVEIPEKIPPLQGDPKRFRELWGYLLENIPLHAGPNYSVRIVAEWADGLVTFDLDDDGKGMSPRIVEQAFEPFFSGLGATDVEHVGGGLALARAIVERHGGWISALPSPSGGVRIRFVWPAG